jgi:hypothetical protein
VPRVTGARSGLARCPPPSSGWAWRGSGGYQLVGEPDPLACRGHGVGVGGDPPGDGDAAGAQAFLGVGCAESVRHEQVEHGRAGRDARAVHLTTAPRVVGLALRLSTTGW